MQDEAEKLRGVQWIKQRAADLRSFTYEELETFLTGIGEKRFRAGQVFAWLSKGVQDFDEMTNLSKQLREKLSAVSTLSRAHIEEKYISKIDGTVKYLIGLGDGECVETVVMRYHHGVTVCISSQVGCAMGCGFCASTHRRKKARPSGGGNSFAGDFGTGRHWRADF